ncbi:MAG: acetyl-CoA carboxylase biotin carboxylase subunit [Flavobacteriales bacterium TMED288]|nr:biotin carboxylase [Flavobacteriales bacterium]RPG53672.1 MAG: acetyl-CoA carboxylase biotin carboxylase subunit [Flavobacteriales bacterium TMED288]|tara:strand:+ start:7150 stop:8616 length:1467 start_codon:yes stop_codon:yes gene_type:complete
MKKVLVANRGEIAIRIIKSLKELGILTVSVFSEFDRKSLHVLNSDESYFLGPSISKESYLNQEKIIDIALKSKVDAIHPGYGFLSENHEFASKVLNANIIFIGPSAKTIKLMGNKILARESIKKYNVPILPGSNKIKNISDGVKISKQIGFPILIKAAAGGGGKGMRIVKKQEDFNDAYNIAKSEALSSFGDGDVFIEKFLQNPRHIEVQILADNYGNIIHLFERECSIQRRHQKVVEEAPSVALSHKQRDEICECAKRVAMSCKYVGAGTVEFLFDKNKFYFLEMNTRIQVEHPITEFITSIDIVKQQIHIALNKKLQIIQKDIKIFGHSIELRVYAEDSENDFNPDIGFLKQYIEPNGIGVRVDSGYQKNMEIPIYYDSLISKLIVHGKDRIEAIARMKRAIGEYHIMGIKSTLDFGLLVMNSNIFVNGDYDTNFIKNLSSDFYNYKFSNDEKKILSFFGAITKKNESNKIFIENKKSLWVKRKKK